MTGPRPRWLLLAFALSLVLALAFASHALWVVTHLKGAAGPVEPWMTPGYVVRAYDLAPEALAAALGVEPGAARGRTLAEIAKDRGVPVEELLGAVQALVPK